MQGNPDGFETVRKLWNYLEKSGQFLHHSDNGKWSGKIQKVVKLSGKWEMICKSPDSLTLSGKWDVMSAFFKVCLGFIFLNTIVENIPWTLK